VLDVNVPGVLLWPLLQFLGKLLNRLVYITQHAKLIRFTLLLLLLAVLDGLEGVEHLFLVFNQSLQQLLFGADLRLFGR
jgi:hypothetical protein